MSDVYSYQSETGYDAGQSSGNDGLQVTHGIVVLFFVALVAYMACAYGVFRKINNAL